MKGIWLPIAFVAGIGVGAVATWAVRAPDESLPAAAPTTERTDSASASTPPAAHVAKPVSPAAPDGQPLEREALLADIPPDGPPPRTFWEAVEQAGGDAEAMLLLGESIDGRRAMQLVSGPDFAAFITTLSQSTAPGAAEHYVRQHERLANVPVVRDGAATIDRIACGAVFCALTAGAGDEATLAELWGDLTMRGPEQVSLPETGSPLLSVSGGVAMVTTVVRAAGNGYERRVLMTVGSDFQGVNHRSEPRSGYWAPRKD